MQPPSTTTIFSTERLVVRPFTPDDSDDFYLLHSDAEVMKYIRPAKTRAESDSFLKQNLELYAQTPLYGRWGVWHRITGVFAGSFAVIPVAGKQTIQLGYALMKSHWGKGYATELTVAGLGYVFLHTPVQTLYAYTEEENLASQNVLLKAGFRLCGASMEENKRLVEFDYNMCGYEKSAARNMVNAARHA